jgi:chromosome partitioning protein
MQRGDAPGQKLAGDRSCFESACMHVIAVANRKGGVGKSSLATNLAAGLAEADRRVLVIDMDSQASATAILCDGLPDGAPTTTQVLLGTAAIADTVRPSTRERVWLAPAAADLTQAQLVIAGRTARETILRRALRHVGGYDVAIIDTATEQQLATMNSLVAATHVLMPFTPDPKALEGLATTARAVEEIAEAELGVARVLGCVQIGYDRRLAVTRQARDQVQAAYGELLFETAIRTNSSFIVCPAWHRDIFALERQDGAARRGSDDYRALAAEFAHRLQLADAMSAAA